jgi:hypothetical protein
MSGWTCTHCGLFYHWIGQYEWCPLPVSCEASFLEEVNKVCEHLDKEIEKRIAHLKKEIERLEEDE